MKTFMTIANYKLAETYIFNPTRETYYANWLHNLKAEFLFAQFTAINVSDSADKL